MVLENAQLYPTELHTKTQTRGRLLDVGWARRDGDVPRHGTGTTWRRSTDLITQPEGEHLRLSYRVLYESDDGPDDLQEWDKLCDVCGDVLACGAEVSTLRVRDGDLMDDPMSWLDTDALVPAGEGRWYVIRFGHEIVLEFRESPMEADSGTVAVKLRKLEKGSAVVSADVTFSAGKRNEMETRRRISIELPGGVGTLKYDQREDDQTTFVHGKGESEMFPDVLFDIRKMLLHPHLGSQPKIPGK